MFLFSSTFAAVWVQVTWCLLPSSLTIQFFQQGADRQSIDQPPLTQEKRNDFTASCGCKAPGTSVLNSTCKSAELPSQDLRQLHGSGLGAFPEFDVGSKSGEHRTTCAKTKPWDAFIGSRSTYHLATMDLPICLPDHSPIGIAGCQSPEQRTNILFSSVPTKSEKPQQTVTYLNGTHAYEGLWKPMRTSISKLSFPTSIQARPAIAPGKLPSTTKTEAPAGQVAAHNFLEPMDDESNGAWVRISLPGCIISRMLQNDAKWSGIVDDNWYQATDFKNAPGKREAFHSRIQISLALRNVWTDGLKLLEIIDSKIRPP